MKKAVTSRGARQANRGVRRQLASFLVLLGVVASAVLVVGVTKAQAVVVNAAPTWPIPVDAPIGPPPIPLGILADLPTATGAPPPADQIVDPLRPAASCGDWYPQSIYYGNSPPTASIWWEYRCTYSDFYYYDPCAGPACDASCPSCYTEQTDATDYFFWDGTNAVFYGEAYDYYKDWTGCYCGIDETHHWWDAPTAQWYDLAAAPPPANAYPTASFEATCVAASCSFDGSSSADSDGTIQSYAWDFGDGTTFVGSGPTAAHTYASSQSYWVMLTVADDLGAVASKYEIITVEVPNIPPIASFSSSCAALGCDFDAGGSADDDGTIVAYSWDFGDGSTAVGKLTPHAYTQPGTYTVTLTVADDAGATATVTNAILVIRLTASGYKVKGLQKVDLSWNGASSQSFAVNRNGVVVATVAGGSYTDTLDVRGARTYVYKVCVQTMTTCSNEVTVNFSPSG